MDTIKEFTDDPEKFLENFRAVKTQEEDISYAIKTLSQQISLQKLEYSKLQSALKRLLATSVSVPVLNQINDDLECVL